MAHKIAIMQLRRALFLPSETGCGREQGVSEPVQWPQHVSSFISHIANTFGSGYAAQFLCDLDQNIISVLQQNLAVQNIFDRGMLVRFE